MVISLVSRGVVSGLCLVIAKYWYDRREGKDRIQAADGDEPTETASHLPIQRLTSAAEINLLADASTSDVTAGPPFDAASNEIGEPKARTIAAGSEESAAAQAASGNATDTAAHEHEPPVVGTIRETYRGRQGERKDDDLRVEEAMSSRDLSTIDALLQDIGDPVLRNRLLRRLVTGYYRRRSDALHRAAFYRVALLQMEEASSILEGIEEIGEPRPQSLEAFKSMAIALDEDGSPDGAIAVCEMALSLGLQDGTKSGFEGRIARLRHRQKPTGTVGPKKTLH